MAGRFLGINVRSTKEKPFADLIVDGFKTIETRESDSLHPYVGERIAIVRTGMGKAFAIGAVTITGFGWTNSESIFNTYEDMHMVEKGSPFYIKPNVGKFMYFLENAVRYKTPVAVGRGVVARQLIY
jgi:predicted transcriptional regulator